MRYRLFIILAAAAAVVGCAKDDTSHNTVASDLPISFVEEVNTRNSENLSDNNFSSMGVYAVYTEKTLLANSTVATQEAFMYNQNVERTNSGTDESPVWSSWTYSPIKYWPSDNESNISFIAFAPYNNINREVDVDESNREMFRFSHTISTSAEYNSDLLWADIVHDRSYDDGDVKFEFEHAMGRILVAVRVLVNDIDTQYSDERFSINGVTLYNVYGKAYVSYADTDDTTDIDPENEDLYKPFWTIDYEDESELINLSATSDHTLIHYDYSDPDDDDMLFVIDSDYTDGDYADGDSTNCSNTPTEGMDYSDVMEDNRSIFILPQTLHDDASIEVRIRYYTGVEGDEGELYSTVATSLKSIIGSIEKGQTIRLNCTVNLTDEDDYYLPMSVLAEILGGTDVDVNIDIDENIYIYADRTTIDMSSGSGTVSFYSNADLAEENFEVSDGSLSSFSKSINSDGSYNYTMTITGSIVKVTIPNGNYADTSTTMTKVFNFTLA